MFITRIRQSQISSIGICKGLMFTDSRRLESVADR